MFGSAYESQPPIPPQGRTAVHGLETEQQTLLRANFPVNGLHTQVHADHIGNESLPPYVKVEPVIGEQEHARARVSTRTARKNSSRSNARLRRQVLTPADSEDDDVLTSLTVSNMEVSDDLKPSSTAEKLGETERHDGGKQDIAKFQTGSGYNATVEDADEQEDQYSKAAETGTEISEIEPTTSMNCSPYIQHDLAYTSTSQQRMPGDDKD